MKVALYYRNNDSFVKEKCLEFSERFADEKNDCFSTTELKIEKDYIDWFGEKIFYYSVVDKSDLLLCTYESLTFSKVSGNAYKLINKGESISIWKNL